MMQKKRSFFERLTGSVSVNEDEDLLEEKLTEKDKDRDRDNDWIGESSEEGELTVDVYQTPSEIVIKTMVAGVKPEDLNVAITRDMVTIKGRREETREIPNDQYFQRELYWGSFSRAILLPAEIEVEEAEAIEKHGLLTIRLLKIDKDKSQTLKIKSL